MERVILVGIGVVAGVLFAGLVGWLTPVPVFQAEPDWPQRVQVQYIRPMPNYFKAVGLTDSKGNNHLVVATSHSIHAKLGDEVRLVPNTVSLMMLSE